jgi:endonuclease/exonuclease/phosphatase family metal-dependent hydrolase
VAPVTRVRVVTYNIHRARGLDGRQRLDRIVDVLGEIDADIVALQEVLAPQAGRLAEATGMREVFGRTRVLPQGPYGNLCLTRLPLVAHQSYSLTCRPFEPRGCLRADIDAGAVQLHIFNVHLGLHYTERIRQVRMLTGILDARQLAGPRLLLGDFNEWFNGHASRLLRAEFGHPCGRRRSARTHPSVLPMFPLDRIYHDPTIRLERVAVHRSRLARLASDHLPTFADLRLEPAR